ncbi:hypothetical protein EDD85DRAFT_935568 [Armillaria nabsnona]|nr:hypothetical protein EDD85DRAFT_935568 [Armillaria nabsnona]
MANTTSIPSSFLHLLSTIIHNPDVVMLFEAGLKNNTHIHKLLDQHIIACTINGRECYKPSYLIAFMAWIIIQTADSTLEELAIASQDDLPIAKLYGIPNYLLSLACSSRQELKAAFGEFQAFIQDTVFWLTYHINYSVSKGFNARINWGAYIGLQWDSFLFQIVPSRVINEACKQGVTANEVIKHYVSNDDAALTRYITPTTVTFPDIAAWLHFPYDPHYPPMLLFKHLPQLLTYPGWEDTISSPGSPPDYSPAGSGSTTDVEMTDDSDTNFDVDNITEIMSRMFINDDYVKMEVTARLPVDEIMEMCTSLYSYKHPQGLTNLFFRHLKTGGAVLWISLTFAY